MLPLRIEAVPLDTREPCHGGFPCGEISFLKLVEVVVSAGACHDFHELDAGVEGIGQAAGGVIDFEPFAELGFLRGHPGAVSFSMRL